MDITDVLENQSFVHVGVDLAKNVFQVAYKEQRSNTLVNQQMNRTQFEKFATTGDANAGNTVIYR